MSRLRPHLTYANVMATIAVVAVVGGGSAYAGSQLGKNSVKARNIAPGAVKTSELARKAVRRAKIAPGAVDDSRLANASVGSNKLIAGSVTTGKLATGAVSEEILSSAVTGKINAFQPGGTLRVDAHQGTLASAPEHTLLTRAPFRIYAKCWDSGGVRARVFASTSQAGALMLAGSTNYSGHAGEGYLTPSTPETMRGMGPESAAVVAGNFAAIGAWGGTLIHGATAIQVGVVGFVKGAVVPSDGANYGAGGERCAFNSYLLSTG